jgi:hypothetical protein
LQQVERLAGSGTRHLLLVLPTSLGKQQLGPLLRLVRQQLAGRAPSLCIVSESLLARLLAEQLGFASAATLDEARGLLPGQDPTTSRRPRQPLTPMAFPALQRAGSSASLPAHPGFPQPDPPASQPAMRHTTRPTAHLEQLLQAGYLPNPAASPSLEEEAQRAASEETPLERLSYEISDPDSPSLAQQESEEHEAQIIATIRKPGLSLPPTPAPPPPAVPEPPPTSQAPPTPSQTPDGPETPPPQMG